MHWIRVYNAGLDEKGLESIGLAQKDSDHVRQMDSVKYMPELREVGKKIGEILVKVASNFKHFI